MCHELGDHFLAMNTSSSFLHCFPSVIGDIMNYALSPRFPLLTVALQNAIFQHCIFLPTILVNSAGYCSRFRSVADLEWYLRYFRDGSEPRFRGRLMGMLRAFETCFHCSFMIIRLLYVVAFALLDLLWAHTM
jgi:hypothetical protein